MNFPAAARVAELSGSPVIEVEISADGHLKAARVERSGGVGALDQAALTVIQLANPFDPFPPDLAAQYSTLRFAYQYEFVAGSSPSDADADANAAVTPSADSRSGP